MKKIIFILPIVLLLAGCSGYRMNGQWSVSSVKTLYIVKDNSDTNNIPLVYKDNLKVGQAPIIIADQVYVSLWGGSAASNSVLSNIQLPIPVGTKDLP